jgi:uncharacterized membrane protein
MASPRRSETTAGSGESQILEGKIFALLSYLSILCILPLLFKRENTFVLQHGKQGLVIFLGEVAVFIIHIILGPWIFRLGIFIFGIFSFLGIIAVLKGRYVRLPVVADIADKITL